MLTITSVVSCQLSLFFAFTIFLRGYFPIKENVTGFATKQDLPPYPNHESHVNISSIPNYKRQSGDDSNSFNEPTLDRAPQPHDVSTSNDVPQSYDRLVIILIDALRQDFVFDDGSPMVFTRHLINRNKTVSFVGRAHPPTVTMPRIKALVGGGIPGFIDVVLNVESSSFTEDNLLSQLHRDGRTLVHYGDDTWLRLFPEHFTRSDGTISFFVNDYTEVDNNVTRHLPHELKNRDWDVMVLHYLGLDHIGHIAGPKSPLIPTKLWEMDEVIKMIYTALVTNEPTKRTLIMVCGDHGMSQGGSHGGGSLDETLVPMVLLMPGQPTLYEIHDQIDIVPTIATLLGVPIPRNSLGVLVKEAISHLTIEQRVRAHQINAYQLLNVLKKNSQNIERENGHHQYTKTVNSHSRWLARRSDVSESLWSHQGEQLINEYVTCSVGIKDTLSASLLVYDMYAMCVAMVCIAVVLLLLLTRGAFHLTRVTVTSLCVTMATTLAHLTICTGQYRSHVVCGSNFMAVGTQIYMLGLVMVVVSNVGSIVAAVKMLFNSCVRHNPVTLALSCLLGIHSFSLLSSSFVEEEHQTWYFFVTTIHVVMLGLFPRLPVLRQYKFEQKLDNQFDSRNDPLQKTFQQYFEEKWRSNHPYVRRGWFVEAVAIMAVLVLCRVCRSWNQTGDKGIGSPDIKSWLMSEDHAWVLTILVITSLVTIVYIRYRRIHYHRIRFSNVIFETNWQDHLAPFLLVIGLAACYAFRSSNENSPIYSFYESSNKGVLEARTALICSSLIILSAINKFKFRSAHHYVMTVEDFLSAWIIFSCLVLRVHNIPLVALLVMMEDLMYRRILTIDRLSTFSATLYFLCLAQASFFYQGNSNKLTSLDVSAGYIGMETHHTIIASVILALSTYSMFIFWMIVLFKVVLEKLNRCVCSNNWKPRSPRSLSIAHALSLSRAVPLLVYTLLATLQRYHLFVWTVFSPKLLYEGMLTVIVILCCGIIITFNTLLTAILPSFTGERWIQ